MTKNTFIHSWYWFVLFAINFVTYELVQVYIRPKYSYMSTTVEYLLGVAPNFFPAIGIPCLFILLFPLLGSTRKWMTNKRHFTANLVSVSGLVVWEYLQQFSSKGYFDWHDIIWTFIGAILFQIIWFLSPNDTKL
ncbi:MAG: hypothetical protein MUC81_09785 [Bacteroidia bacterium]|nr:hypothetical protein [Bacteroidia bacterium]